MKLKKMSTKEEELADFEVEEDSLSTSSSSPNDDGLLSSWHFVAMLSTLLLIVSIVTYTAFYQLPIPLEETDGFTESFLEGRARHYLKGLLLLGPRQVGSKANAIEAVEYLNNTIQEIKKQSLGFYEIEHEVQIGSIDNYIQLQNVIVKIIPKENRQNGDLLLNSHFDSGIGSYGAGDDGSMVAVMLEVLHVLLTSEYTVKHPIVFLLNGAEETPIMCGSQLFIEKHRWFKNITTFINLEGMGTGGKDIFYRTSEKSLWLHKYYSSVAKHPYANVIVEDANRARLLPLGTDANGFYNKGLAGVEIGYLNRPGLYHTHNDHFRYVDRGSLQHAGDNVLALTRALANADEVDPDYKPQPTDRAIFFDVFRLFVIVYSETTSIVLNIIISASSVATIIVFTQFVRKSTNLPGCNIIRGFSWAFCLQIGSYAVAGGFLYFIQYIIRAFDRSMVWFARPWAVFGLYFCPFIVIAGAAPFIFAISDKKNQFEPRFRIQFFLHSHCLILIILNILAATLSLRSAYPLTFMILFYTISVIFNILSELYNEPRSWLVPILIGQILPFAYLTNLTEIIFTVLDATAYWTTRNAEFAVMVASYGGVALICGFMIPVISIFRKGQLILLSFLIAFVLSIILTLTGLWFPFDSSHPQMQYITHARWIDHTPDGENITKEKSFYTMINICLHTEAVLKEIGDKYQIKIKPASEGPQEVYEVTYFSPNRYYYSEAPSLPNIQVQPTLKLLSKSRIDDQTLNYTFTLTTEFMYHTYYIQPPAGSFISNWTFPEKLTKKPMLKYEFNMFFGRFKGPYQFSINIQYFQNSSRVDDSKLKIDIQTTYTNYGEQFSREFTDFLEQFPDYTVVTGDVSSFDKWSF